MCRYIDAGIYIYIYINKYICLWNMGMRRNRPSYEYKSSFWPLPGMMVIIMIMVRARNYKYNLCGARQKL